MSEFSVGDKVVCVQGTKLHGLIEGQEYVVRKYSTNPDLVWLEGDRIGWHPIRFILAEPKKIHPHHDIIIAWLNGEEIEYRSEYGWRPVVHVSEVGQQLRNTPLHLFSAQTEYRVKPKESEKDLKIAEIEGKMRELADQLNQLKEGK